MLLRARGSLELEAWLSNDIFALVLAGTLRNAYGPKPSAGLLKLEMVMSMLQLIPEQAKKD